MKEIDLGLSVKWSDCNLGSSKPEDTGGYYQWGGLEDVSKLGYLPEAPYRNPNIQDSGMGWFKYNTKRDYSTTVDNKIVLDLSDDIANITLGDSWYIPTDNEWAELENKDNCTWTWTTINSINGYKVTSNKKGYTDKFIFLPAAGEDNYYQGSRGFYWSSSLNLYTPYYAWYFYFHSSNFGRCSSGHRYCGQSIRPICRDK